MQISRARHYSTLNISETVQHADIAAMMDDLTDPSDYIFTVE